MEHLTEPRPAALGYLALFEDGTGLEFAADDRHEAFDHARDVARLDVRKRLHSVYRANDDGVWFAPNETGHMVGPLSRLQSARYTDG